MNRRDFIKALPVLGGQAIFPARVNGAPYLWLCGLIIIGIGIVVTIKLYQVCKKAFPPADPPPPPPPQPCDCNMPGCTCPKAAPQVAVNLSLADDDVQYFDVSSLGYTDPKTGAPILTWFNTSLMSSPDCKSWQSVVGIQGWYSMSGFTLQFTMPGQTINTYLPFQGTLPVPVEIGSGTEPARFFKLA